MQDQNCHNRKCNQLNESFENLNNIENLGSHKRLLCPQKYKKLFRFLWYLQSQNIF